MASEIEVNLDTSKELYGVFKCKQNDDLLLIANIYENGAAKDLANCSIVVQAKKSDNTYVIQNTDINKSNNTFTTELARDFTRAPGETKIEVVLIESGKQNTTFSFCLEVVGSVIRGAEESKDLITSLEVMQDAVVEMGKISEETKELIKNSGAASKEEINKVNTQLAEKAKQKEVDILEERMNTFTSLPNGSTTGDAELADGRIASDGFKFDNIGSAIREQAIPLDLVRNLIDKSKLIPNRYYGNNNGKINSASISTSSIIEVDVEENTTYSLKEYFSNFTFWGDDEGNVLGKVIDSVVHSENYYIVRSPSSATKLYMTIANEFVDNSMLVLKGEFSDIRNLKVDNYKNYVSLKILSLEEKINKIESSNNDIKMNFLYVDKSFTSANQGFGITKFNTIFDANNSITNNSERNRYTIIVAKGTYTDLQERYSGDKTTRYAGVRTKDYVYYESEDINHPEQCIIEWNGATGLEEGWLLADIFQKCPFHILNGFNQATKKASMHTHIKGFTFKCKNTRYSFHVETEGAGFGDEWVVENCIFDWGGRDVDGLINTAVGCGVGSFEKGKFKNCLWKNTIGDEGGIYFHNNRTGEYDKPSFMNIGADIIMENCDLNRNGVYLASNRGGEIINTKDLITLKNCNNISKLWQQTDINEWNKNLQGTNVDNIDNI